MNEDNIHKKESNITKSNKKGINGEKSDNNFLNDEFQNNNGFNNESKIFLKKCLVYDKIEKNNYIINSTKNSISQEISFEIIKKEKESYYQGNEIEKIQLFIPKKEEEDLEIDELAYLSNIEPKGLRNLGGCCYMNATLQCFYHIKEFTDYFLKNKKIINKKKGLISSGLLDVIEGLAQKDSKAYFSPIKFKKNLIEIDDSFEGTEGKDSADLVLLILSSCHEELAKEPILPDMSLDQREQSLLFLDAFYKNSQTPSIIMDLFSYYVRVENICFECGTKYYSISIDNMMLFSLERVFRLNAKDITVKEKDRIVSIDNCLSCFSFDCSFEKKKFKCKYCQKYSCIFIVKSFATLPKYLLMVMKRGKNEVLLFCKGFFKIRGSRHDLSWA